MLEFQQKRKFRKVFYSRLTIFLLFVAVIFLARATYNIYTKEQMSADDYATVLKNYNDLNARQTVLTSQMDKLGTESGQEEEIRSKFSVVKPGETVVMVVGSASSTAASGPATSTGLWQKFVNLFK